MRNRTLLVLVCATLFGAAATSGCATAGSQPRSAVRAPIADGDRSDGSADAAAVTPEAGSPAATAEAPSPEVPAAAPVEAPPAPLSADSAVGERAPIRVVPVTGTVEGLHVRQFELTRDGSVLADGRKVAALVDSEVRDRHGAILFWVRADGALVDRFGNSQVRFSGDVLVEGHNRFLVAPRGRIVSVLPAGSEVAGKVHRGARHKRTVLVTLFAALAAR
jgi:hypothetical protein